MPPITYKIGGNVFHFGRDEFISVTSFPSGTPSFKENKHSPFCSRVFPSIDQRKRKKIKPNDLIIVFNEEALWTQISDDDAVWGCLLIVVELVFFGRQSSYYIPNHILSLVENFDEWNSYPWGEYLWSRFYNKTVNVVPLHYNRHYKKKIETSSQKPATYNLDRFVWALKDTQRPDTEASGARSELFLDDLSEGVTGTMNVMVFRSWDVHTTAGRYLNTDFVLSDAKGNAIHGSARANVAHNFLKLKKGSVYAIKNFVVHANKDEYRIFRNHTYMVEFDGATSVRKKSVKGGGFVRYPFQLVDLASVVLTENKYLIDVAGYVTNVGRITYQKSGSRTLDFSLANGSGQAMRVTLWGGLGDALVEKKTNNVGLYPVVLTAMNVKLYNNKLYLSSGSSSQILDDPEIPALRALRTLTSEDEGTLTQAAVQADYSQAKEGTLENLLIWARNRKNDGAAFKCKVKIDDIRTRKGWNFPSCGGEKCKKGVVRRDGSFWCQACDKGVEYPVLRYRLELDVSDRTSSTVVVLFDEPATELVKCSAASLASADDVGFGYAEDAGLPLALANLIGTIHNMEIKSQSYYEHGTYESFTCWRIVLEEPIAEDIGSSNTQSTPDENLKKPRRLIKTLNVETPAKSAEERGSKRVHIEDSDDEATGDMEDGNVGTEGNTSAGPRKKKRYIIEDSTSE